MDLVSVGGETVRLRPVSYQYGAATPVGEQDWDANWLVVVGDFRLADGRSWSFSDASLTTWGARSLGHWLRAVVAGEVRPAPFDGEGSIEVFTEPDLAFSLAARALGAVVLRVHLSLAASPPWVTESTDLFEFFVSVDMAETDLAAAVDEWHRELRSFPTR